MFLPYTRLIYDVRRLYTPIFYGAGAHNKMQCILVLVIVLSLAAVTLAAIHPIDDHGADNLKVRGESFRTSSHDVLRQLRAAGIPKGIPTAHRAALNDSNFRAIIQYSGSDSKVDDSLKYTLLLIGV